MLQLPTAPEHMHALANQTVPTFGYDRTGYTEYSFNSLGYRGSEFESTNPVVVLGNSISFGIGLPYEKTFSNILNQSLNVPVYNFSWGCYAHTNHEQLELLEQILSALTPKLVIWQINNLNRCRINGVVEFSNCPEVIKSMYHDFWTRAQQTLVYVPHILLHWDNEQHGIDFSHCLIYNKYHVDSSLTTHTTHGVKSNRLIALKLLQEINEQRI